MIQPKTFFTETIFLIAANRYTLHSKFVSRYYDDIQHIDTYNLRIDFYTITRYDCYCGNKCKPTIEEEEKYDSDYIYDIHGKDENMECGFDSYRVYEHIDVFLYIRLFNSYTDILSTLNEMKSSGLFPEAVLFKSSDKIDEIDLTETEKYYGYSKEDHSHRKVYDLLKDEPYKIMSLDIDVFFDPYAYYQIALEGAKKETEVFVKNYGHIFDCSNMKGVQTI